MSPQIISTQLSDAFFEITSIDLERRACKKQGPISADPLLILQGRCADIMWKLSQPTLRHEVSKNKELMWQFDLLQRATAAQNAKIEKILLRSAISLPSTTPPEEVALLQKALANLDKGKDLGNCFSAIRTLMAKHPKITGILFGHVWRLAGSPMPPSSKAHPKFGKVAFFGEEGRSVSTDVKRASIEATLKELDVKPTKKAQKRVTFADPLELGPTSSLAGTKAREILPLRQSATSPLYTSDLIRPIRSSRRLPSQPTSRPDAGGPTTRMHRSGMSSASTTPILDFYRNGAPNIDGTTLLQMQSASNATISSTHDRIQWLFPTSTRSRYNGTAETLTSADIAEFKRDPALKKKLLTSFGTMLRYFGLKALGSPIHTIVKDKTFSQCRGHWLTPGNHNFDRISRMLNSMTTLGLENEAKVFLDFLRELNKTEARNIGSSMGHWEGKVKGGKPRTFPAIEPTKEEPSLCVIS